MILLSTLEARRVKGSPHRQKRMRVASSVLVGALSVAGVVLSGTAGAFAAGSFTVIATIPASGVGIVVNSATNTVYTVNGGLTVIDGKTNTVEKVIPLGGTAQALALNHTTNTVYVANREPLVTVIDGSTNAVVKTFPIPTNAFGYGSADEIAVDDSTGAIYVDDALNSTVYEFDGASNKLLGTIKLGLGTTPGALGLDPKTHMLFVGNAPDSSVLQISETTNTVVGSFPVSGAPSGIAIDSVTGAVLVSIDRDNSLSIARKVNGTFSVSRIGFDNYTWPADYLGPSSVAVDSSIGAVYLTRQTSPGEVIKVDEQTGAFQSLALVGNEPWGIAVNPVTGAIFTSNKGSGTISVVSKGSPPMLFVDQASILAVTYDTPFSIAIRATGGTGRFTYAVGGGITPGLSLNSSTGILAGTPTAVGNYGFLITATDSAGALVPCYVQQVVSPKVSRVSGSDRYATSVAVSQAQFPNTVTAVFVASGANFPDGLSAGPVAAKAQGPVLLTDPSVLPTAVATEIRRLNPVNIEVVGGPASVSAPVFDQIQDVAPAAHVTRVFGANRYETSEAVVRNAFTEASTIFVTTGKNFPDALTAGGAAGAEGAPLLLLDGEQSSVDSGTASLLKDLGVTKITIAGGTASVSAGLASSLASLGVVTRLSGPDRYATSVAVNANTYPASAKVALIAAGTNFPDALSASSWSGLSRAPLFLSPGNCVHAKIINDMSTRGVNQVYLIGGPASLGAELQTLTQCLPHGAL